MRLRRVNSRKREAEDILNNRELPPDLARTEEGFMRSVDVGRESVWKKSRNYLGGA